MKRQEKRITRNMFHSCELTLIPFRSPGECLMPHPPWWYRLLPGETQPCNCLRCIGFSSATWGPRARLLTLPLPPCNRRPLDGFLPDA